MNRARHLLSCSKSPSTERLRFSKDGYHPTQAGLYECRLRPQQADLPANRYGLVYVPCRIHNSPELLTTSVLVTLTPYGSTV